MSEAKVDPGYGERVLNAVERIVAGPEELAQVVEGLAHGAPLRDVLARRVISHYSNLAALVGGATALPAMIPGVGTAAALVAGPLADMVLLLKYEVELCLCLSLVHGHDIRDPRERQLAFLLAALKTVEQSRARPALCDAVDVVATSIWNYTPRRVGKLLATCFAIIAAVHLSRGFVRALPLVGVVVGATLNKVLTSRVGHGAHHELRLRGRLSQPTGPL